MKPLRFAVVGTGFWANYQIAAWQELGGVDLVAVCDVDRSRATAVAQKFGLPKVYDDATRLLQEEPLDFVDIITGVDTHRDLTLAAAAAGIAVICQKPMAANLADAREMVRFCSERQVPFFIQENFRWQAPVRALKKAIDSGVVGAPFKARVSFCSAFPVFDNQPFLARLEQFILTDVGSHVLDICRYLFGEARTLYGLTRRVNPAIRGEDVANVLMEMENGLHCFAELSYASVLERESFPQTLVLVEGQQGSLQLTHDFELRTTTRGGTVREVIRPRPYDWADPDYAVVHSSIVDCNRDILNGLRGGVCATTGADNLKTMELVWAAYESATSGKVISL